MTRFAPSPSGHLHVGGARTALFCWAFARGRGGRFIVRIEDTDQKRSSDAASLGFLRDLQWLGIDWDEGPEPGADHFNDLRERGEHGPYFQSKRIDIYRQHVERLIAEGKAYRAFETPEELEAARKKTGHGYRYDRAALKLDDATVQRYMKEGRPHVVRLKVPDDRDVLIRDLVLGEINVAAGEIDDFVIIKADGFPTYHFAVVIDDELMNVTHVIRAQEHLKNTAKHMLLQESLGFQTPAFAHLSVITNPDGSKMSKRDKDKALRRIVKEKMIESASVIPADRWQWWLAASDHQLGLDEAHALADALEVLLPEINVDDFRRAGYLPEVIVNYLALLGWNPGENVEKFDVGFLIERFDLDRVQKSPAKFDREKLLAFNLDAIQAMAPDEFVRRYREHCAAYHAEFIEKLSAEQFELLARANQPRSKTLDDQIASCRFFVMDDDQIDYEDSKAVRKALTGGEPSGFMHLQNMVPKLKAVADWSVSSLESSVKACADQQAGSNLGKVAQPLRIAVSGTTISPAIFETMAILGRERTLNRIQRCLAHCQQLAGT